MLQHIISLIRRKIEPVEASKQSAKHSRLSYTREKTYHVWDLGSAPGSPDFSIVNRLGPSEPCRSLNPLTGIRDVPVVN